MATKPTTRIPDWASGGTRTDPGAGKEASGWTASERPPAQWWNWILSSFGQWLSWAETSIDAIEPLIPLIPVAIGSVDSTGAAAYQKGVTISSFGYTGNDLLINFSSALCTSATASSVHVSGRGIVTTDIVTTGWMTDTDTLRVSCLDVSADATIDLSAITVFVSYAVYGTP